MAWLTAQQAASMTEEQRLDYLTRTVLGEAVGEGYVGMIVVGQVIANRTRDARFPADPVAVAGQSWQFTTNSPGEGGNQAMVAANYGPKTREYQMARAAVEATVVNRTAPDITGGAVQYHTIAMGWPETWPTSIQRYGHVDIGNHRVYPTHPVPPADIPGAIAELEYQGVMVGTMLDVRQQGLAPIRPASLSSALTLQRETNRVAQSRANAPETIRRSRAMAFNTTIDPFDTGRPSNTDPIINRPEPAMKESMQRQLRATGTPNMTERTFALQNAQSFDGGGPIMVSDALLSRPPAVVATPWGVRETVAAQVAAAAADNGRNQMVMSGNPNIAGSVVDWLYPQIEEGTGEANQEGKGPRAVPAGLIERGNIDVTNRPVLRMADGSIRTENSISIGTDKGEVLIPTVVNGKQLSEDAAILHFEQTGENLGTFSDPDSASAFAEALHQTQERRYARPGQSIIERSKPAAERPGQSTIERGKPIVIVSSSGARVVPQSIIERDDVVTQIMRRANEASKPELATTLANQIATRRTAADVRTIRDANQSASDKARRAVTPPSSPIERAPTKAATRTVIPGPSSPPKKEERLVSPGGLDFVDPPRNPPRQLPPIAPPKSNPIGVMPDFRELAQIPADPLRPVAPSPLSRDRATAARNKVAPLAGRPETETAEVIPMPVNRPSTRPSAQAPTPADPSRRPVGAGPTTRPVATTRVTTTAPQPASVEDRVTARNKTAVTTVARSAAPATTRKTATPAAAVSSGQSSSPSQSSSGSGSGGSQAPTTTYVRESTGERLTAVTVSSYDADTQSFSSKTVYR